MIRYPLSCGRHRSYRIAGIKTKVLEDGSQIGRQRQSNRLRSLANIETQERGDRTKIFHLEFGGQKGLDRLNLSKRLRQD
ncbi:hypothetical protein KL920_005441, partial [Ogataea angusta]